MVFGNISFTDVNFLNKMNVLKFGGKSIATPDRFKFVADMISKKSNYIVIIPAIPSITSKLEEISNYFYKKNPEGAINIINELKKELLYTIQALYSDKILLDELAKYIDDKIELIRSFSLDLFTLFEEREILAQGELISTHFFDKYLQANKIDSVEISALDFMRIDRNSEPDTEFIKRKLAELLKEKKADIYITQGYICRNAYGEIDDFRKGGNDYSATLIGAAITATEIQIWTDTEGIYNINPQIISTAKAIESLSFDEAAELAYFGDKILHPTSILPAKLANIPVRVLSILSPEYEGTLISDKLTTKKIKAVATKDNITAIKIKSGKMLLAHGFLRKVFEVFEHYRTPIDMLASSEVGVSLTIDNNKYINDISDELRRYGTISIDSDMSIICIIGDLDWEHGNNKQQILDAIKNLPVRMISYGGSNYNISLLVRNVDKKQTLESLNKNIFYNN